MSRVKSLLDSAVTGDAQATAELFDLVYDELKRLAASQLARERPGNTLQPTALVHEAYLRLIGDSGTGGEGKEPRWESAGHFFAAAAAAMRRILIESARRKKRAKRGGGRERELVDLDKIAQTQVADDLLALDEALTALSAVEPVVGQLVLLRYFGGLTIKEAAATLKIAPRTADAHWAYARAWLLAEMRKSEGGHEESLEHP